MKSRDIYRIAQTDIEKLELRVSGGLGKAVSGEVIDLSNTGIDARFSRQQAPVLAIGEEIELAFRWCDQEFESLGIQAQVVTRTDEERSLLYGFSFLESPGLTHGMMNQLFNRRSAHRAKPKPGEEIEVQLWVHNQSPRESLFVAKMVDISVLGLGIMAEIGRDAVLKNHDLVDVSFKLPGSSQRNTITARLITRKLRGDVIHYGLQFSKSMIRHLTAEQNEIAEYIIRREEEEFSLPA